MVGVSKISIMIVISNLEFGENCTYIQVSQAYLLLWRIANKVVGHSVLFDNSYKNISLICRIQMWPHKYILFELKEIQIKKNNKLLMVLNLVLYFKWVKIIQRLWKTTIDLCQKMLRIRYNLNLIQMNDFLKAKKKILGVHWIAKSICYYLVELYTYVLHD